MTAWEERRGREARIFDTITDPLRDRVAFLEARVTELQAANNMYLERARKVETDEYQKLWVAASNIYRCDWVWAHKDVSDHAMIGSKFWISLRDALGLGPTIKWARHQQRAAIDLVESTSPTTANATGSGVRFVRLVP